MVQVLLELALAMESYPSALHDSLQSRVEAQLRSAAALCSPRRPRHLELLAERVGARGLGGALLCGEGGLASRGGRKRLALELGALRVCELLAARVQLAREHHQLRLRLLKAAARLLEAQLGAL